MSRNHEKKVVGHMVAIYCRGVHNSAPGQLCPDCQALLAYAWMRIDRCPHTAHKTTCRQCVTHCYSPAMRESIRQVMRYAGPRMLLHHPIDAVRHLAATQIGSLKNFFQKKS